MNKDLAFGGTTLVLSAAYYWTAAAIPKSQLADAVGPQGLPRTYAVLLCGLSLILIVGSLRRARTDNRNAPPASSPSLFPLPPVVFRAAGMIVIGLVYIAVVPWLGYLLSIAALILATTYYQGGTVNRQVAVVALSGGIFFWLLFVVMMGIAQPPGWWPPPL